MVAACGPGDATDTTEPEAPGTSTTATSTTPTTTTPGVTTSAPTTTSTTPAAGLTLECASPEGFTVMYPESWETNEGDVVPECTMFDPDPFSVPDATDARVAAITIYVENVEYSTITDAIGPDEELSRDVVTIDGLPAHRVEWEPTGDGLFPDDTLITAYYVDLEAPDQTLVAETIDLTPVDYDTAVEVLDSMVATLDIDSQELSGVEPIGQFMEPPVGSSDFPGSGEQSLLTEVRFGVHDGFERVVFEFEGGTDLSYLAEYVEEAIPPSGNPVAVDGEATLQVTMTPASGVDLSGEEPVETYTGSDRIQPASAALVNELVLVEDFEATLRWAIGLPFRSEVAIDTLDDPHRLVVDIAAS